MNRLNNKQLLNIKGGASVWAIIGAVAAAIFGIGVIDGLIAHR